jgi:hypothetical protein
MRRGATQAVLRELREHFAATPRTGPGNKGRRERLKGQIKFLSNNLHRMNYAEFLRQDWDLGTGAAEGAMRNLIAMRLDGPGMRWSPARAECVLHLRQRPVGRLRRARRRAQVAHVGRATDADSASYSDDASGGVNRYGNV